MSIEHRTPGDWVLAALGASVAIGIPAYAVGFFLSYFMNDIPGTADHVTFIAFGVMTAIASTVVVAALSGAAGRGARAPAIAASASVAVNGTFLAGFFALTAESFDADSVHRIAIGCGVVAVCAVAVTVRTCRSGSRLPTAPGPSWSA